MEIQSLRITPPTAGELCFDAEGISHKKFLPCLSVVQALHGSYDIALGDGKPQSTGEGGVFVAPADVMQTITHHDGQGNYMRAHWAMFGVTVNELYRFEDLFSVPLILPEKYNARIEKDIREILQGELCRKYAAAYDVLDILRENASPVSRPDFAESEIRGYIAKHFAEELRADDLAEILHCSKAQVYRYTKKYFGLSPANYVNRVRLQNVLKMLQDSDVQIKRAAFESGFSDLAYFSRFFKKTFGLSPREYQKKNRSLL